MIGLIVLLYTFLVTLVTSNPLQGFQSYPVIQYQQNYRNVQQPIVIEPSDYTFYPQQYSVQNQLAQQSNPYLSEDYSKRLYLNSNLSNQRVPLVVDPYGIEYQLYGSSPIINVPYGTKEYAVLPIGYNSDNNTVSCKNNSQRASINQKQTITNHTDEGIKAKRKSKKAHKKNKKIKSNDSSDTKLVKQDNNEKENHQSNKNSNTSSKKSRPKIKSHKTDKIIDEDDNFSTNNHIDQSMKRAKNMKKKKTKKLKSDNVQTEDNNEKSNKTEKPIAKKRVKQVKSRSNNENDKNHSKDNCLAIENENCFDINENCAEVENRKTRNYYKNGNKPSKPPFYMPFDYSANNIASYINNIMSNPQLNTQMWNANDFYYNLDYLYQLPQFQALMVPQDNINKRANRKKNKKKFSKDNTTRSNNSLKENNCESCKEIKDNLQELLKDDVNNESITSLLIEDEQKEEQVETNRKKNFEEVQSSQTIFDLNPKIRQPHLDSELNNQNIHEVENDENVPYINGLDDEYYPDFTADSIYNSNENQYWEAFHDRHYYFSDDKSKTKNKPDFLNTNDAHIENCFKDKLEQVQKDIGEIKETATLRSNKIPTISSKQIDFMTPPALEYPDFKTQKINTEINDLRPDVPYYPSNHEIGKEIKKLEEVNADTELSSDTKTVNENCYSSILEMHYEPSNKISKKYQDSKMSTYSSNKFKSNDINDQNNVETIFVKSKVVKYGPIQEEVITDSSSESIENQRQDKNLISYDGNTYVVLAKSIPDDFY